MKPTVKEIAVFGLLGALMFISKIVMEFLPNIHLIGMFIVATTVIYRQKALYPLYVFVFLTGVFNGFATWWIPYLYIWTVLWGMAMLLPKRMPKAVAPFVYAGTSALHGLLYGTLYAPAQALLFGLSVKQLPAWIAAGLPFDVAHAVGNAIAGVLIVPLILLLRRIDRGPIRE